MSDLAGYTTNTGQDFVGSFVGEGGVGPIGPKGDPGEKGDKGEKPIRGIDYFTQDDINQMVYRITDDANSVFNENVAEKTADFNTNASNKTTDFNTNSTNKTNAYNGNASDKIDTYNTNASTKTSAFNDNYDTKLGAFNTNATNKTNDFNNNASSKTTTFDNNATSKTSDFNSNATSKTGDFNTNATNKTNSFNSNASDKTTDFNNNYDAKIAAFDDHVSGYAAQIDNLEEVVGNDTDTFSTSSTYAIGDAVVKDNKFYRCKTAITTAGAWDSSKWEGINVRQELDELEEHLALVESNYDTDTTEPSSDIHITDSLNGYNQGIAVVGNTTQVQTPAPDNPSDIIDVTGTQEIVDSDKNTLTGEYEHLGFWVTTVGQTSTFSNTSNMLGIRSKVIPGVTYTISRSKITSRFCVGALNDIASTNALILANNNSASNLTVTIPEGYTAIAIYLSNNSESSEGINLQIEHGSTATPYVPHKGQNITLHLGDIHLSKIGNYRDVIFCNEEESPYYDGTLEDGAWYLHKEIGEATLNGSETYQTWGLYDTDYFSAYCYKISDKPAVINGEIISNYFVTSDYNTVKNAVGAGCFTGGNYIGVSVPKSVLSDVSTQSNAVASLKVWLSNNVPDFNYALATFTNTKITSSNYPELYADLQELDKMQTYKGGTSIVVTASSGNPAILKVTYYKDHTVQMQQDIANLKAYVLSQGANI